MSGDSQSAEAAPARPFGEDPSLPQISNLADILYRNGRYEEAREAYERAAPSSRRTCDGLYFKLGNIAYKRGTRRARGRAGAEPPSSIRGTSWREPTSRCWT
jgi:tetratricopeptide (TPR) repeat protein